MSPKKNKDIEEEFENDVLDESTLEDDSDYDVNDFIDEEDEDNN